MKQILSRNEGNIERRSGVYVRDIYRRYLAKFVMPYGAANLLSCFVEALDRRITMLFALRLARKQVGSQQNLNITVNRA